MWIESPTDAALDTLAAELAARASELESTQTWPEYQLRLCAQRGVFRWFVPEQWDGVGWAPEDIVRGYLKLSAGCLTTTFIITQYTGASRRIASGENPALRDEWLPRLARGETFGTVGVSHLTTSRQHLRKPVLRVVESTGGFELDGMAPWVTGASAAEILVVGGSFDDGREVLLAVPAALKGVQVAQPARLVGLTASHTGPVEFKQCFVPAEYLLAGPIQQVMNQGIGAGTGGVQTSTLAVGLANAAIDFLEGEAARRSELDEAASALRSEANELEDILLRVASGEPVCSNEELRTRVNSLALRSAQAALTAAKGAGYVVGHPAGRWCREALFFLVWSCPQPVMAANLCELAGLID